MGEAPGWWRLWLARTHAAPPRHDTEPEREPEGPLPARLALHKAVGNRAAARLSGLDAGRAMPPALRATLESRLGRSVDVRVHEGPAAARVAAEHDATALAAGRDVVLGEGAPDPASAEGERLLAHEVAHTVQQQEGTRPATSAPGDPHERAADSFAAGEPLRSAGPAPALQRQQAGQRRPQPRAGGAPAAAERAVAPAASDEARFAALTVLLQTPDDPATPAPVRAAIAQLQGEGIPLSQVVFERLVSTDWAAGVALEVEARSRWVGGTPHIALGRASLGRLDRFLGDPVAHLADGLALLRTVAHELRHLSRERPDRPAARTVGRTVFERAMVRESRRLGLTPQQTTETDLGRDTYRLTEYPAEEVLARLAELAIVRIEWNAAQARGRMGTETRDRFEALVRDLAFAMRYQLNQLQAAAQTGVEGLGPGDYMRALEEIEHEVLRRYGRGSDEFRLWRLVRAGGGGWVIAHDPSYVRMLEQVFP